MTRTKAQTADKLVNVTNDLFGSIRRISRATLWLSEKDYRQRERMRIYRRRTLHVIRRDLLLYSVDMCRVHSSNDLDRPIDRKSGFVPNVMWIRFTKCLTYAKKAQT